MALGRGTARCGRSPASEVRPRRDRLRPVGLLDRPFLAGEIGEFGEAVEEDQLPGPDRAVPMLGDDQVGKAVGLLVGVAVVVLAEEEGDDVGVLLDLAGLTQVRELWLRRRPLLGRA